MSSFSGLACSFHINFYQINTQRPAYGIKMIQFAIFNGLNVRSTMFPHKDIHKETWYAADGRTANQIDHILISNRFRGVITDIAAPRGPDSGADHN